MAGCMVVAFGGHAEGLRDPTQPIEVEQGDARDAQRLRPGLPVVQSILIAPSRRVAIVNGTPVVEGSKVNGYTILRIAPSGIVAEGPQGQIELKLLSDVKQW